MQDFIAQYTKYLLSAKFMPSCVKLAELLGIDRNMVHREINTLDLTPRQLFDEVKTYINLAGGQLSIDDSVLDKPYSQQVKTQLISYFWSGLHKDTVLGLDLLTLFYTDPHGVKVPINRRIIDKEEGKTKNEYFREMVEEVLNWGIIPSMVTGDSWFSGVENLKFLQSHELSFLFAVKNTRLVSMQPGIYQKVSELVIPEEGLLAHLKDFGFVKLFKKNDYIYIYHDARDKSTKEFVFTNLGIQELFEKIHQQHWGIEQYHKCIKQVCNVENHYLRNKQAITNHIFLSLRAFTVLEVNRSLGKLDSRYSYMEKAMKEYMQAIFSKVMLQGLIIQSL